MVVLKSAVKWTMEALFFARNNPLVYFAAGFLLSYFILPVLFSCNSEKQRNEFEQLLKDSQVEGYQTILKESGLFSAVSFVNKYEEESSALRAEALKVKQFLLLRQYLKKLNLQTEERRLVALGVRSLHDLHDLGSQWSHIRLKEPSDQLTRELWLEVDAGCKPWSTVGLLASSLVFAVAMIVALHLLLMFAVMVAGMTLRRLLAQWFGKSITSPGGLVSLVTGRYLCPQKCRVVFEWEDPHPVGSTLSFSVQFVQRNGQSYLVSNSDNILIEVSQESQKVSCSVELVGDTAKVQFTVRRAGEHRIDVLADMAPIRGSPFIKTFLPGPPDPLKTSFVHHCSVVVGSEDIPTQLFVEPRDRYGNHCTVDPNRDPSEEYTVDVVEVTSCRPIPDSFRWECHPLSCRLALVLKFPKEGCYRASVSHRGRNIQNGDFHVIVLNKDESYLVQKNVAKKNKCYEVKLVSMNGVKQQSKPKKVYCYISPKQLTLKEFMWKFFPKHLITFRLCPSTKFRFDSPRNDLQGEPVLVIDDGCRQEVELVSSERNIIAATFTQFLLKNIGGSETFKDKQDFFYHEVRKFHQKHFHDKLTLKITRENLLECSFKETKSFSVTEWCKNFEITFIGEEGLDWGGLRREWFELLCGALFDPQNSFFHAFKNDAQGLVHPCPSSKRAPHLKLKYYEFAGKVVGKCLYESALGSSYRQLVKAKFSRSFLAQLIGLSVHYKYFEHDDPDLFVTKVKYILENDIESMGLCFMEEVYDLSGQLVQEVDLIPGGSAIPVTNANKVEYLNALAQWRLSQSVRPEVEHFLKGLNELIPDNLLCIFDENELELLMCGTGSYSISEFKANHVVSGSSYEFRKVLDWFWIAVSNFTEEEMARLLQFTTGCSQLPPGGFAELSPNFHITAAPTLGNLPTAHTCFNQLCLPDYDSYDHFERALRLAINEGSEGFGMV